MTHKGLVLAAILGATAMGGPAMAERDATMGATVTAVALETETFAELAEWTQIGPLVQIVATEGARHGIGLEKSLFPGRGGAEWAELVSRIQSPDRLRGMLLDTVQQAVRDADLDAIHDFYGSALGQRIAAREVEARRMMLDAKVEQGAMDAAAKPRGDDVRAGQIDELIDALDLVTANVSGGLNANFAFYQGLGDGGAMKSRMTESELLAMVWGQEDDIRRATSQWLKAHLTLAYAPLADDELDAYIDFARTPEGKRYSAAMFEGFGEVFEATSYELGRAAAEFMGRQDI
ncbi:DUF2059 domain-containing protein [Jannaschia sp. Os4]|uniref:DUF2059 domain-containing protein n=1 Tax=Jannaschia sp. Os4 TaxID=2807617 RepID=UPI001939A9E6|nr:DUF2059 domain-containing protein [Jannaschia sp. Os4]MBM2576535.1 DUF2059 domain-containing protein [Jannaschia sp. Os4]